MALSEVALASFVLVIWMYWQERMKTHTEKNSHSLDS